MNSRYKQSVYGRTPTSLESPMEEVLDLSGPIQPGVVESGAVSQEAFDLDRGVNQAPGMDYKAGGVAAAANLAKGGNAKDAVASGLVATGNPLAIGAGLGLMTLSSIEKKKQQQKETEYKNKLAQVEARKSAIDKLAQIGQGMRA